jgi:hypothetical protein
MDKELKESVQDFLAMFELVFEGDWDHTKSCIVDSSFISSAGSFLSPPPWNNCRDPKGSNWSNRAALLSAYDRLKNKAIKQGCYKPYDHD